MDAKIRVVLATAIILLVGVPALTVGGNGVPGIPPPDNRCDVECNKEFRQCWAQCQGSKEDPLGEAACWTTWQICQWQCDVAPPSGSVVPVF